MTIQINDNLFIGLALCFMDGKSISKLYGKLFCLLNEWGRGLGH